MGANKNSPDRGCFYVFVGSLENRCCLIEALALVFVDPVLSRLVDISRGVCKRRAYL
jgi:hypothetical protein